MSRTADRVRFVEAIWAHWRKGAGSVPSPAELLGIERTEEADTYWHSILVSLEDDGLVRSAGGYGLNRNSYPTADGEEWIEEVLERRKNPAERRKAAARGLLHWLDVQDQGEPSWINIGPAFNVFDLMGEPLSECLSVVSHGVSVLRAGSDR
jgi:hypothetical protein